MTPAGRSGRLAAMHKIGDLFVDDMGMLLMIVSHDRNPAEELYWICDDVIGNTGKFWYKTEEVTAGKKLLDRMKEQ